MKTFTITLSLDEIDCISDSVCRDQGRRLDELSRSAGIEPDKRTRLLTDAEMASLPVHQAVLLKIEKVLPAARWDDARCPRNALCVHEVLCEGSLR
jgi:hypothetical protein